MVVMEMDKDKDPEKEKGLCREGSFVTEEEDKRFGRDESIYANDLKKEKEGLVYNVFKRMRRDCIK